MCDWKHKFRYLCPYEKICLTGKRCRALTAARPLKEPVPVWIKCLAAKKATKGAVREIVVTITDNELDSAKEDNKG